MESTINDKLPRELLADILLRLPVKVISQCKCVCKHWCSFIESPSFVKQHFEQETNKERLLIRLWVPNQEVDNVDDEPNQNDHELVYQEPNYEVDDEYALLIQDMMINQEEYYHQLALEEDGEFKLALYVDETLSEYEVPYLLQMPGEVTDLIGPLNGVFCVVTRSARGPLALLNPTLRQFKPLPLIQRVYPPNPGFFGSELAFGLDPLSGDYKLVMLLYFLDMRIGGRRCVPYVCTSESDSWRMLEDVDPIISRHRVSTSRGVTYLNGVYYWLLESNNDATNVALLAFNMMTDEFREIPVTGPAPQSNTDCLALCGESLALLMCDHNERCIDVWMMVNEGCWVRRSRVGPLDSLGWPLYLWKNDEILLETVTGFLTRYNISTQESKIIEAPKVDGCGFLPSIFVYKESLVSIKGEAGKCKLWDPSSDFVKDFFKDSSSQRYS